MKESPLILLAMWLLSQQTHDTRRGDDSLLASCIISSGSGD